MITATEALRLPGAALKPTDAADTEKILAIVEEFIRGHDDEGSEDVKRGSRMSRRGAIVPISLRLNLLNDVTLAEVSRRLRRAGWRAGWKEGGELSPITGQITIDRFDLALTPDDTAYDEVDSEKP